MDNTNHTASATQALESGSRPEPASEAKAREDKPAARGRGRGSAKRDDLLDILRDKRKAGALLRRLTLDENKALQELLVEVIITQEDEEAERQAEHQKKLAAAKKALRHLQEQGVSEKEFALLLDEARKEVSG